MAHYLVRFDRPDDDMKLPEGHLSGRIVEADSAKQAVESFNLWGGDEVWEVEVWTLRSGEPRVFKVTTESVRTVRRVE